MALPRLMFSIKTEWFLLQSEIIEQFRLDGSPKATQSNQLRKTSQIEQVAQGLL